MNQSSFKIETGGRLDRSSQSRRGSYNHRSVEGRIKQVIRYGEWFALRKKQRLQRKRLRSQYKGINSDSEGRGESEIL